MAKRPKFKSRPGRAERNLARNKRMSSTVGDRRDGEVYVYRNPDIELAVNIALVTGRPLLVSGPTGCGKSSLALNVALTLGWRYYEYVTTARSDARSLLYRIDEVRRLADANTKGSLKPLPNYIEPGPLWWAFDRQTAKQRGAKASASEDTPLAADPTEIASDLDSVVLLDEIDKADPDLPNNLLVALGSLQFRVEPLNLLIDAQSVPLIFITTNRERELPAAFVRRCVCLELPPPTTAELIEIAKAHTGFGNMMKTVRSIAQITVDLAKESAQLGVPAPSVAEFLDALRACKELDIKQGSSQFEQLRHIVLRKRQTPDGEGLWG